MRESLKSLKVNHAFAGHLFNEHINADDDANYEGEKNYSNPS